MKSEILGEGVPEVAVVGLVHGDEVCGLRAINRFKRKIADGEVNLKKPVKLVLANEKAFEHGKRFVDSDLNRAFPGDKQSSDHEENLAAELIDELRGLKILDFHASRSPKTPFGIISGLNEENMSVVRQTLMDNVIEISFVEGGLIGSFEAAAVVEAGLHNQPETAEKAFEVMLNFLAVNQVIDQEFTLSDPDVFQVYDRAEGSGFEFTAENFAKVKKGEVFASKDREEKIAEESFYPVLMSTDGYDDMIGFQAKKLNKKDLPKS